MRDQAFHVRIFIKKIKVGVSKGDKSVMNCLRIRLKLCEKFLKRVYKHFEITHIFLVIIYCV